MIKKTKVSNTAILKFTYSEALDILLEAASEVKSEYEKLSNHKVSIEFTEKLSTIQGYSNYNHNGNCQIVVGIHNLNEVFINKLGDKTSYIKDGNFVAALDTLFHESRHLKCKLLSYENCNKTFNEKVLLNCTSLASVNDNYYNINRLFMITITKKEEVVLNQVEIFNPEYPDGVPIKFLKDELGFHEYDLVQILNTLSEKNLIEFNGSSVKLTISDKEINAVKSKKDVEKIELNIKEKESYNLIKELVDDKNLVSKYTLEGHLLYGDLKLSNFKMYHIILSLENKNLLKPIKKEDGDYYLLVE